ncbi:MAG: YceD family protein [Burkholderiaceae bacterium]|jgi:uncharacterized protein|nr:YceD family protein [Burkholderiaceae bacterium]
MAQTLNPRRLDVARFARQDAQLGGQTALRDFARVAQDCHADIAADNVVEWLAHGEFRAAPDGSGHPALHLRARAQMPMVCQRCLEPMLMAVAVDRHFVFLSGEAQATALDDASEDDLLALVRDFDLLALIEDELMLAMPLVPRHAACPGAPRVAAQDDAAFEAAMRQRRNPFAALESLKKRTV